MEQQTDPARWSLPAGFNLAWHQWDDEYVVHHALSNDTHRLSELAGQILFVLRQSGPHDLRTLAGACQADGEVVAETLLALERLDLVERC